LARGAFDNIELVSICLGTPMSRTERQIMA
jgi:hypothetical protein